MAAKTTLPGQHTVLHERWPTDCCLCAHEAHITELETENVALKAERDRLAAQVKAVGDLLDDVEEAIDACLRNLDECPSHRGDHCNDVTRVHDRLDELSERVKKNGGAAWGEAK